MRGPRWDTPKQLEIAKMDRLGAKIDVAADDPRIAHLKPVETMWTGRVKRNADRSVDKRKGRAVLRGDLHKQHYAVDANQATAPVVRSSSMQAQDCVAALRQQHCISFDAPSAYLQGIQTASEQVVARAPPGFREYDERGVELYWLMHNPLYGQLDAGAIWNRTFNHVATSDKPPHGCSLERCHADPCVYAVNVQDGEVGGQVNKTIYVDDGRMAWDPAPAAERKARDVQKKLSEKFDA